MRWFSSISPNPRLSCYHKHCTSSATTTGQTKLLRNAKYKNWRLKNQSDESAFMIRTILYSDFCLTFHHPCWSVCCCADTDHSNILINIETLFPIWNMYCPAWVLTLDLTKTNDLIPGDWIFTFIYRVSPKNALLAHVTGQSKRAFFLGHPV